MCHFKGQVRPIRDGAELLQREILVRGWTDDASYGSVLHRGEELDLQTVDRRDVAGRGGNVPRAKHVHGHRQPQTRRQQCQKDGHVRREPVNVGRQIHGGSGADIDDGKGQGTLRQPEALCDTLRQWQKYQPPP